MKRRIQYIISLLLLFTFPISAIGMNISVHKCRTSGKFHISLTKVESCNCQKIINTSCCTKLPACKYHKAVNSCCSKKVVTSYTGYDAFAPVQKLNKQGIKGVCCTVIDKSFSIKDNYKPVESPKIILSKNFNVNDLRINLNPGFSDYKILFARLTKFPIKELIKNTIEFIHHSTLASGESEIPAYFLS